MTATPSRDHWAVACSIVYGVVIAIVVFAPVSYSRIVNAIGGWVRDDLGITWFGAGWIEFAGNILMFVPLGFLLTLLFRHPWYGTALAVVISAGVEIAQIVIPDRQATLRDVVSNSVGAAVGAVLAWLIVLRRDHKRARHGTSAV